MIPFSLRNLESLMWMTLCFISFFVSLYPLFGDYSFIITLILAGFLGGLQAPSSEVGILSGLSAGLLGCGFILIVNTLLFELGFPIQVSFALGEPFLLDYVLRLGAEDFIGTMIIIELAMLTMAIFGALGGYFSSQGSLYIFDRANRASFRLQTYCPKCGRNLMSSDRFCSNCGLNLIQIAKMT
ncbi:MAG: zinc ribbon domain-containing protein [Candidatus Hodarchaeota archaeon]